MTIITDHIEANIYTLTEIFNRKYRDAFELITQWRSKNPGKNPYNDYSIWHIAAVADSVSSGIVRPMLLDNELLAQRSRDDADELATAYAARVEGRASTLSQLEVSEMDEFGAFVVIGYAPNGQRVELHHLPILQINEMVNDDDPWLPMFPCSVIIDGVRSTEKILKTL